MRRLKTGADRRLVRDTLLEAAADAARVLRRTFGRITNPRQKGSAYSIVCDADLAAEQRVLRILRSRFARDAVIAEESGFLPGESGRTWVIDPLDGTSNFVAGLPWFGVQIALLEGTTPVAAVMHLPIDDVVFFAEAGGGAFRNGRPARVTVEPKLSNTLCAFGFDPEPARRSRQEAVGLLMNVAQGVRNLRTTNSLFDFCYTVEGHLGGCVNLCTKIWDIAPVALILPEAGGVFSDLDGQPLEFDLHPRTFGRTYRVLGAAATLHGQLSALTRRGR